MPPTFRDLRQTIRDHGFVKVREAPHGEIWRKTVGDIVLQTTVPRGRDSETVPRWLLGEILRQTRLDKELGRQSGPRLGSAPP